jgi:hypothetical protein
VTHNKVIALTEADRAARSTGKPNARLEQWLDSHPKSYDCDQRQLMTTLGDGFSHEEVHHPNSNELASTART